MKKDISPEEKLLNVIRAKKGEPSGAEHGEKRDPYFGKFGKSLSLEDSNIVKKAFSGIELSWVAKIKELKYLNVILFIFLIGMGSYLLFEIFSAQESPLSEEARLINSSQVETPSRQTKPAAAPEEEKPFTYYSKEVKGKELFKSSLQNPEETKESALDKGEKEIKEALSNISLLGIVKGEIPQAIIEDKKAQKTYFLNKGDSFGEFKIIDILENKVVVEYKGREYALVI